MMMGTTRRVAFPRSWPRCGGRIVLVMSRDPARPADDRPAGPGTGGGPLPLPAGDTVDGAAAVRRVGDERQRTLDARERQLDARIADHERRLAARESAAEERDRAAAARERAAELRERLADLREVAALERLLTVDTGTSRDPRRRDRPHPPGPRPEPGE